MPGSEKSRANAGSREMANEVQPCLPERLSSWACLPVSQGFTKVSLGSEAFKTLSYFCVSHRITSRLLSRSVMPAFSVSAGHCSGQWQVQMLPDALLPVLTTVNLLRIVRRKVPVAQQAPNVHNQLINSSLCFGSSRYPVTARRQSQVCLTYHRQPHSVASKAASPVLKQHQRNWRWWQHVDAFPLIPTCAQHGGWQSFQDLAPMAQNALEVIIRRSSVLSDRAVLGSARLVARCFVLLKVIQLRYDAIDAVLQRQQG
jgi:hypothetical protein